MSEDVTALGRAKAILGSRFWRTVKVRLMLLSLAGAVTLISTLAIVLYLTQQRMEKQAEQDALLLAQVIASEYRTRIHNLQQMLALLARWPEVKDSPPEQCAAAFPQLAGLWHLGALFGLASSSGAVYCNSVALNALLDSADHAFLAQIGANGNAYRLSRGESQPHLLVAHPVTGRSGQVSHVVVGLATLDWSASVPEANRPDTEPAIVLANREGQVLAVYPPGFAGTDGRLPVTDEWSALWRHGTLTGTLPWPGEPRRIAGFATLQDADHELAIGVFFDRPPLWHHSTAAVLEGFLLVAGTLLVVFLLILYSNYRVILRYLTSLVRTARRMAAGDYSVRSEWSDDPSEFGSLARAFNALAENLALREQKLREQAEQLERSNVELEQFAYVASHDLKEPLRMVASFCDLLQQRYSHQLDARAQRYIHYAVDGAQRMQTLISDLLMLARVGNQASPPTAVDCQTLLQEVVSDLRHIVHQNQAQISFSNLPCVQGDATQLAQLFRNLLVNALKFRGTLLPQIRIEAVPDNDGWAFAVGDNGIGIAPEYLDRIFLIFQRLHQRDSYPGNGIGLAVCKKIVERHGGRIWVESTLGAGSTFHFTLPQTSPSHDEGQSGTPSDQHKGRSVCSNGVMASAGSGRTKA
ncbi:MAG: HAMP domain-containing protein [Gammaproteobacteria bacterium]|nr:HAMP domain-containing protein [Gammaproteobacteria bacterium]MCP5459590.1 HAMP domain-containing protein [Gammaproteobacteria bacterium]